MQPMDAYLIQLAAKAGMVHPAHVEIAEMTGLKPATVRRVFLGHNTRGDARAEIVAALERVTDLDALRDEVRDEEGAADPCDVTCDDGQTYSCPDEAPTQPYVRCGGAIETESCPLEDLP